jgi:tRNA threonylcarbamoyladenosine biosynthesis protein TsaE
VTAASISTTTASAKATMAFASSLAQRLVGRGPLVLSLEGDLGAGKTTFVRGFVAGLVPAGQAVPVVQSPTYALMRRYPTTPPVHHLDLYRLHQSGADPLDSLESLGLLDALDEGFSLVEWPLPMAWPVPCGRVVLQTLSPRRRKIEVFLPAQHLDA